MTTTATAATITEKNTCTHYHYYYLVLLLLLFILFDIIFFFISHYLKIESCFPSALLFSCLLFSANICLLWPTTSSDTSSVSGIRSLAERNSHKCSGLRFKWQLKSLMPVYPTWYFPKYHVPILIVLSLSCSSWMQTRSLKPNCELLSDLCVVFIRLGFSVRI